MTRASAFGAIGAKNSQVAEDYLKEMWGNEEAGGDGISVNDLAARMGVAASTASENVARLTSWGFVTHEPYKKVHFTTQGRQIALGMVRRHRLLETYLHDRLGFEWDEVHEEAEILEHAVSDRLLEHIDEALGWPARDPHGDPIPDADGRIRTGATVPLSEQRQGEWVTVARLSDEDPQGLRDLDEAGIGLDSQIRLARLPSDEDGAGSAGNTGPAGEQVAVDVQDGVGTVNQVLLDETTANLIRVRA